MKYLRPKERPQVSVACKLDMSFEQARTAHRKTIADLANSQFIFLNMYQLLGYGQNHHSHHLVM